MRAYVSVADSQGVPITGLDSQSFQVQEDDKPVSGLRVQPVIDSQEPVAIAFIIDVSGSMNDAGKLDGAKQAASAYVDTMGPNDSAALISFSDEVKIVQGYTSDREALKKAINQLTAKGDTAIYDAVIQAAILQGAVPQRRKVMLLMTDGEDNRSKQSLDAAISAARNANTPVFAIGLGGDVKKDVLNKLAASTGAQAIYATAADQLKQIFLSIGDQLRREYAIEYTSKLAGDDSRHTLAIKATYRGQESQASGTFLAQKAPLVLEIAGIANATSVSGTRPIEVTVRSGNVRQLDLLVDGQTQGTLTAAPFVFQWDTTKVAPGIHKVVVRATDPSGATTDKEFAVEVANAPVATPTAAPTATPAAPPASTAVQAAPTAVPTPAQQSVNPLYYALGAVVVVGLLGGGALAFFLTRRPSVAAPAPAPVAPPPPPREQTVVTDRTEAIGLPPVSESTVVSGGATVVGGVPAAPRLPRAKLVIVQNGTKSEVTIQQVETILGREASNPIVIRDPMSSRRHAKIVIENGEFWIEDLKSLNGTRVNGEVITRRRLANNDQIKIGDAILTFVADGN